MEQADASSQGDASQAEASTSLSSLVSESPSSIQYTILKNELKIINAKLKLIKALIFEKKADVQHTSDLESALREYASLAVVANLTELGLETSVECSGSSELLTRMIFPPDDEADVSEDSTQKVLELLDKIVEPNHKRTELKEKISDVMVNMNSTVLQLQQAIADYNDILVSQAQELKSETAAVSDEYGRLKKKIQLKLAKINLMKTLSCNLLGLGHLDIATYMNYADKIKEMRKPLTFHDL